jgi:hypothetical protein
MMPVPSSFSFPDALYQSVFGNGVQTQNFNLYSFFWATQLYTGKQFTMVSKVTNGFQSPYTLSTTFTYGTAGNATAPTTGTKQFYARNYYDGANIVYVYGFYSGNATSSPNGQVTLIGLSLV